MRERVKLYIDRLPLWLARLFAGILVIGFMSWGLPMIVRLARALAGASYLYEPKNLADAKSIAEIAKDTAQALAWLAGGLFFLYKVVSGYLIINMSIRVDCIRRRAPKNTSEYLQVTVILTKGDTGTVTLYDAYARVSPLCPPDSEPLHFSFDRLNHRAEGSGTAIQYVIDWQTRNQYVPTLNLTPGETMHFSWACEVPVDVPCTVDVVVMGKGRGRMRVAQWRARAVCLPETSARAAQGWLGWKTRWQ